MKLSGLTLLVNWIWILWRSRSRHFLLLNAAKKQESGLGKEEQLGIVIGEFTAITFLGTNLLLGYYTSSKEKSSKNRQHQIYSNWQLDGRPTKLKNKYLHFNSIPTYV